MDDRQGANRQGDQRRSEGGEASKGINPVQHSEREINPAKQSEGRRPDETPGGEDEAGDFPVSHTQGNG